MVLEKTDNTERDGWDILCYNHNFHHICRAFKNEEVNLHWWEAIKTLHMFKF